jgi:hypothetical protein
MGGVEIGEEPLAAVALDRLLEHLLQRLAGGRCQLA